MTRIAILGSGMAGFGAAHRLYSAGLNSVLYEKKPYHGGHTTSYVYDNGFTFDDGPHISYTKDERIKKLFAESVNQEFSTVLAKVNNYWKGRWIKHPVQCNLHGLPPDLVVNIIRDFVQVQHQAPAQISNYKDWLFASYGRTFAETFPMEYGLKNHTAPAEKITVDWLGTRLYQPSLEEVLQGALSPNTPDVHYITEFRYPLRNGFVSFLNLFVQQTQLYLNHEVVGVDPKERRLRFANGTNVSYDFLISSIPLPELIPMISGTPLDVIEAAQQLAWTSVVIVNIGINRPDIVDAHWSYIYDRDVFFTRLCTPHMQSPRNAPPGAGSLQAEVYFSKKYKPFDRSLEACIETVCDDLRRIGLLRPDDKILLRKAMIAPYGNIIFDHDRPPAIARIRGYLDDIGVFTCGRYGEWGHHWTDEAFLSGENAAQRVLDQVS